MSRRPDEEQFFAREEVSRRAREEQRRERQAREAERTRCPKDGEALEAVARGSATMERCPRCGGVWLDAGELERLNGEGGAELVRDALRYLLPDPTPDR